MGPTGLVFNIMRFSTRDGPGLRTTVFLKGCPLACAWCHNPESQSVYPEFIFRENRCIRCGECLEICPEKAIFLVNGVPSGRLDTCRVCGTCAETCPAEAREIIGREMTAAQVLDQVLKDRPFFEESGGGVTFSGGEPLAQPDFLEALLAACRAEELHTAVDTCGLAPFETFERILPWVDLLLYDLKIMDDAEHRRLTGASNRVILENLESLAGRGVEILIRTPILPGVTDGPDNLAAMVGFLERLPGVSGIMLLPYHETGLEKYRLLGLNNSLPDLKGPSAERLEEAARVFRARGLRVVVGT